MNLKKVSSHNLTLILDGYNVIHAIPELERTLTGKLEDARMALIRYCQDYQERQGNIAKIVLVFDGNKNPGVFDLPVSHYGDIEIIFSEPDQTADDKIIELLDPVTNPGNYAVVSNDNYVGNNARAHRVRVLSVAAWAGMVKRNEKQKVLLQSGAGLQEHAARKITEEYKQYLGLKD